MGVIQPEKKEKRRSTGATSRLWNQKASVNQVATLFRAAGAPSSVLQPQQAVRDFQLMGIASVILASIVLLKAHAFTGVGVHSSTSSSSNGRRSAHAATGRATKCTMDNRSFRTEVHVPLWPEHAQLGYADSFFLIGSCFSDNISQHLRRAKLPTSLNPAHGALVVPLVGMAVSCRRHAGMFVVSSVGMPLVGSMQNDDNM